MNNIRSKKLYGILVIIVIGLAVGLIYRNVLNTKTAVTADEQLVIASNENNQLDSLNQKPLDSTIKQEPPNLSSTEMPILMYHHIRVYNFEKDQIGTSLSVAPEKFSQQLDLIKEKGYTTITFSDLANGPLPEKPIILTFDDGYNNFYQYAFPEIKKRGMRAVVYIITNRLDDAIYMNSTQLKEISESGIELGSHTVSHPDLTTIDQTKLQAEITDSKTLLEKLIGKPVLSFCYPGGEHNDKTVETVKSAGYNFAVTTENKLSSFDDLYRIERYRVNSDTTISGYLK